MYVKIQWSLCVLWQQLFGTFIFVYISNTFHRCTPKFHRCTWKHNGFVSDFDWHFGVHVCFCFYVFQIHSIDGHKNAIDVRKNIVWSTLWCTSMLFKVCQSHATDVPENDRNRFGRQTIPNTLSHPREPHRARFDWGLMYIVFVP